MIFARLILFSDNNEATLLLSTLKLISTLSPFISIVTSIFPKFSGLICISNLLLPNFIFLSNISANL